MSEPDRGMFEKRSETFDVRTNFEITEHMRERAHALAHERGDGNVATGDRGRDIEKQRQDSYLGCLGEIVADEAFQTAPVDTAFGNGIDFDMRFRLNKSSKPLDVEVKTRHHKPKIPNEQRDMFLRKEPSNHEADLFLLVKIYPNQDGVYDTAELLAFCTPRSASNNAVSRDDIADYTNKYMVPIDSMKTDFDVFVALVKKWASSG